MKSKKLMIGFILGIVAIASLIGYLMVSKSISPTEEEYTFEEIDQLLGDLEGLEDIEEELQLDDWDLDIYLYKNFF